MTTEWEKLYAAALAVAVPKVISEQMCSGGVGAAVLTDKGNVYTGVCIDTDCSLGMCAERNALSTMISYGEPPGDAVYLCFFQHHRRASRHRADEKPAEHERITLQQVKQRIGEQQHPGTASQSK